MPQTLRDNNDRMSFRVTSANKSLIMRAVALQETNLTEFVTRTVLSAAHEVIDENERVELNANDTLQVLDLLENPPEPNEKLLAAAFALQKKS